MHQRFPFAAYRVSLPVVFAVLLALALLRSTPALAACVVGTGTSASCTESTLNACLPRGASFDRAVIFNCGGATTITVTSTKIISADTAIDGGSLITISGGNSVGMFSVNSGVKFTVQNLTIANGNSGAAGGGISSFGGTVAITNSTFSGNSVTGNFGLGGGGIYNFGSGTLTVTNSTFSGNSDTGNGGSGGAIFNSVGCSVAITNSTFSGHRAYRGGAIFNDVGGTVAITNSTFSGNSASGGGGSIATFGTVTVTDSSFSDNSADNGGGGIWNAGTRLTVINSTFSGNSATGDINPGGGGILNGDGTLTVTNSTFSDNSVPNGGGGGGIGNLGGTVAITNSTFSGNSVTGDIGLGGGGIATEGSGTLTVTNSTFAGNSTELGGGGIINAGGIFNNGGPVMVINSTFSGNNADRGGGIENRGTLTVTNSTFAGNSADLGGGAIANGVNTSDNPSIAGGTLTVTNSTFSGNGAPQGGAVDNTLSCGDTGNAPCPATLTNTILANSTQGGNCDGTITDGGHNIDDGMSCGFSSANGSLNNADPKLASPGLANNGGPTQTIALLLGSPAINAGDADVCAAAPVNNLDQRGFVRPGTGHANCSIGAYEYNSPGPPLACVGDCHGDGAVTVDELIIMVNVALGSAGVATCAAGDANENGQITIDEIVRAVNATLSGCPARVCGGIAGVSCGAGEVCDLRDPICAVADLAGTCVPGPLPCPSGGDPVCGCDNVTYANDCTRVSAGATLAHPGACAGGP